MRSVTSEKERENAPKATTGELAELARASTEEYSKLFDAHNGLHHLLAS